MDDKKIKRINELTKKSKTVGLTDAEIIEQQQLRNEYRAAFLGSLSSQLDRIQIVEEDGSKTDLKKRKDS